MSVIGVCLIIGRSSLAPRSYMCGAVLAGQRHDRRWVAVADRHHDAGVEPSGGEPLPPLADAGGRLVPGWAATGRG
jgi:hypothetical protein